MGAQLVCTDRSGLDDRLMRSPHYVIEWLTRGSATVRSPELTLDPERLRQRCVFERALVIDKTFTNFGRWAKYGG